MHVGKWCYRGMSRGSGRTGAEARPGARRTRPNRQSRGAPRAVRGLCIFPFQSMLRERWTRAIHIPAPHDPPKIPGCLRQPELRATDGRRRSPARDALVELLCPSSSPDLRREALAVAFAGLVT